MPLPATNELVKEFIARTLVVSAMSYFLLQKQVGGESLSSHIMVGANGAVGSMLSQHYLEGQLMQ